MALMGWSGPCFVASNGYRLPPNGEELDRVIDLAGIEVGFVETSDLDRFWLGPTPESAARGFGSPVLVIDRHVIAWIAVGEVGYQLLRVDTPKGRSTWRLGNSVSVAACPSE